MHKLYRFSCTTGKCEDCGLIDNHSNACHDAAPIRKIEDLYDQLEAANLQVDDLRKGFQVIAMMQTENHSLADAQKIAAMALNLPIDKRPLYDPAADETLKKIDAGIQAIKDMSTVNKKHVTMCSSCGMAFQANGTLLCRECAGVPEKRYCVKCGRRMEAADAAHPFTCEGKGNAVNPAPFID